MFVFLQNMESLEAQLNDAVSDRRKAAESISSLQVNFMITSFSIHDMFQRGEAAKLKIMFHTLRNIHMWLYFSVHA